MYYNTILQLLAGLTNVIGTTYAVLSILKLKPKSKSIPQSVSLTVPFTQGSLGRSRASGTDLNLTEAIK